VLYSTDKKPPSRLARVFEALRPQVGQAQKWPEMPHRRERQSCVSA
jgi:hypothetical protein